MPVRLSYHVFAFPIPVHRYFVQGKHVFNSGWAFNAELQGLVPGRPMIPPLLTNPVVIIVL